MADLKSGLMVSADLWTEAHDGAPFSRLGKAVAGDANFFARIAVPAASLNLSTLEKFAIYLGDRANWPEGNIPAAVGEFVSRVRGRPIEHGVTDAASQQPASIIQSCEKSNRSVGVQA